MSLVITVGNALFNQMVLNIFLVLNVIQLNTCYVIMANVNAMGS